MSHWYNVPKEDMSLSDEKDELHLWLYSDKLGSIYASVKVEDVLSLINAKKQIKKG